jgi:hypothetical protein
VSSRPRAVDDGLTWLRSQQLPSGELPSFASFLGDDPPAWEPDQLNFITALASEVLDTVDHRDARLIVDAAVGFLRGEREPSGLWRYWARSNERVRFTPPDADDTACCSLAVAARGDDTSANVAIYRATAAPDGRLHTWLIPHGPIRDPRVWWALRDERRSGTRALRQELWSDTEADPDDIDAVVNANVCRYLGPDRAPAGAVDWVASVAEAGWETQDKWHRTPYTLWASVADGARRGIERFQRLGPLVIERIAGAVGADGGVERDLDTALALLAVQRFGGPTPLRAGLADALVARQHADGSWAREVFYFGGPTEVFGWASEALTTAYAVAGLAAESP